LRLFLLVTSHKGCFALNQPSEPSAELIRPTFEPPPFSLLPILRLLRLPNVFTAFSNILLGYFFVRDIRAISSDWPILTLLLGASACLYWAGMVLNDLFDIEIDRRERPFRPLPSGQVSVRAAKFLGWSLLIVGTLLGIIAGYMPSVTFSPRWLSGAITLLLTAMVLLYNAVLKHTMLGPLGMGCCRLLNMLLGMSVAGDLVTLFHGERIGEFHQVQWLIACAMGLYVTGITCFAKGEAAESSRGMLWLGLLIMLGGVALMALLPWYHEVRPVAIRQQPQLAVLLFALLGFSIVRRAVGSLIDPQPAYVQATVKHALLSIIVLDAALALLVAPPLCGFVIAALLLPTMLLGRWVYST
jgi:4-hydroxybenzoate polyprenyltransferase